MFNLPSYTSAKRAGDVKYDIYGTAFECNNIFDLKFQINTQLWCSNTVVSCGCRPRPYIFAFIVGLIITICGVPQGSVLSPLLFVMLYHPTQHSYLLAFSKPPPYADDSQLFSPSILVTLTQVSPTSRLLCNSLPPGCLLTFLLLTLLRLNFSLLVSNSNFLK